MMKPLNKLIRMLSKLFGSAEVRTARPDDLDVLLEMARQNILECGIIPKGNLYHNLREYFTALMENPHSVVLLAEIAGEITGMVCCALALPDVWNPDPVMKVWFLYVRPPYRKNPAAVLSLMRAVLASALAWNVKRLRITLDDQNHYLIQRYEKNLGFHHDQTYRIYTLEV